MCAGYVRRNRKRDRVVGCLCSLHERKRVTNRDGVCVTVETVKER